MHIVNNKKANEEISKFKLLSAYGGPGSIVHTEYGSIIVSCIEEWGFVRKIHEFIEQSTRLKKKESDHVLEQAIINELKLSNDQRLLNELKILKNTPNLKYLPIIPDIEINEVSGTIKDQRVSFAISSSFMPKGFLDTNNNYQLYKDWFAQWPNEKNDFFPPQKWVDKNGVEFPTRLKQDNIALICVNGHISDFPWAKYLRWRLESPEEAYLKVDLFNRPDCCDRPLIQIRDTSASASGFDGKWIRCTNKGCPCADGVSLKGLMSVRITCPGHKPWEAVTGPMNAYWGDNDARKQNPRRESCTSDHMNVALTTGNNLYFSRVLSSIFMPKELFLEPSELQIQVLKTRLDLAMSEQDFQRCISISDEIKKLESQAATQPKNDSQDTFERELGYRYQEFRALTTMKVNEINLSEDLVVADVTENLSENLRGFFSRILRVDNLKTTTAQLDFSRVEPNESTTVRSKNIFRDSEPNVVVYPVVENYGEGILFALDKNILDEFSNDAGRFNKMLQQDRNEFAMGAVKVARQGGWQLYLVHTLCHMIMRELEFRCGYPTASLSERIYCENDQNRSMNGFMIYTSEGAEGSMGGLIGQTRKENLNNLILSAIKRATVCNSDPLCWQSDGQGLFELNLASCFSCSLVSETSCEKRNMFLDRRMVVDEQFGFFKALV